jgi:heptosyltransferase-2
MAIALGVYVVAWFGPTSPQEIDLYGRGVKLLADVDCAPCWKPRCNKDLLCNTQVSPDLIAAAVMEGLAENGASGGS